LLRSGQEGTVSPVLARVARLIDAFRRQVVDVSALQHFDRNWDGRQPKEGEEEPSAYRYIILVPVLLSLS